MPRLPDDDVYGCDCFGSMSMPFYTHMPACLCQSPAVRGPAQQAAAGSGAAASLLRGHCKHQILRCCVFLPVPCLQLCGGLRSGQLLAVELLMTPDDPADFLSEAQLQEVRQHY